MSSVIKPTLFICLILSIGHNVSQAQLATSDYEVGLQVGGMVYQGDLSKSSAGDYKYVRPSISIYGSKMLDRYFTLRGGLLFGKIGSDETNYSSPLWKQYRGFKFTTSIIELSSNIVFNPLGQNTPDNPHKLAPYLFAGAGLTFTNIRRDWSKLDRNFYDSKSDVQVGLAIDSAHSLPNVIPVLPVGVGVRYALTSQLSLQVEATYRFTATDYLDGFRYSASPKKMDAYYGVSVGVSYRFGGYKCPTVAR